MNNLFSHNQRIREEVSMANRKVLSTSSFDNGATVSLFSSELAYFVPVSLPVAEALCQTLPSWSMGAEMSKAHLEFITFTTKAIVKQK